MVLAKILIAHAAVCGIINAAAIDRQNIISLERRSSVAPNISPVVSSHIGNKKQYDKKLKRWEEGKMNMSVKEPVSDWNDQFYDDQGRSLAYLINTETVEGMIMNIIHEGKENWAYFLAVSDNNKFKNLINKLKSALGKIERSTPKENEDCNGKVIPSIDDGREDGFDGKDIMNIPPTKKYIKSSGAIISDNDNDNNDIDSDDDGNKYFNAYNYKDGKDVNNGDNQEFRYITNYQPLFVSTLPSEIDILSNFFAEVSQYWKAIDPSEQLKETSNFDFAKLLKFESLNIDSVVGAGSANKEDVPGFDTKQYFYPLKEVIQLEEETPFFGFGFNQFDSEQSEWLKENVMRRTTIIQNLLKGESVDDEVRMDLIEYENGNIFLDPDDNYFINSSSGASYRPNYPMGLLVAFIASEMAFFLI